jgi:phage baseplate assembly protein W
MATDNTVKDFIGGGLVFPIKLVNGKPPIDTGTELIESSLRDILSWVFGTRFFLGEYGSKTHHLLQEPDDGVSASLLKLFTTGTIERWEKRVTNTSVVIIKSKPGVMVIRLSYQIVNTQITGSFIYPYYSQLIY